MLSQLSTEAKISKFKHRVSELILINEDICWLDVSVQYFLFMALLKSQYDLMGEFPDNILWDVLFFCFEFFQVCGKISSRTILHNNVYFSFLMVDHSIVVFYDVRMRQIFMDVDFCDQLLPLSTGHVGVVDLFPDEGFVVGEAADFFDNSEWAFADLGDFLVLGEKGLCLGGH